MHFQELLQRKRIIVRGIVRTIDQGDRPVACRLDDWPPCLWIVLQFDEITTSEVIPLSRIMAKPLPQFGAGGNILEPFTDSRRSLSYASRPQTFDQHTSSVGVAGCLVDALDMDHDRFTFHAIACARRYF